MLSYLKQQFHRHAGLLLASVAVMLITRGHWLAVLFAAFLGGVIDHLRAANAGSVMGLKGRPMSDAALTAEGDFSNRLTGDSTAEFNGLYIYVLFAGFGRLAALDGVLEPENHFVDDQYKDLELGQQAAEAADAFYQRGQNLGFDLMAWVRKLASQPQPDTDLVHGLLQQLLTRLTDLSLLGEGISPLQWVFLQEVSFTLGVPVDQLKQLLAQRRTLAQQARPQVDEFASKGTQGSWQRSGQPKSGVQFTGGFDFERVALREAYDVLGVDSSLDTKALKRRYRQLMSQYHPDKMASLDLSDEQLQEANEKAQQISLAYERILQFRRHAQGD